MSENVPFQQIPHITPASSQQEVTSGTKPTGLATMEALHLQHLIEEEVVEPVTNVVTATLSDMLLVETVKKDPVSPGSMKAVASTERAVSTKDGTPSFKVWIQKLRKTQMLCFTDIIRLHDFFCAVLFSVLIFYQV